MRLQRLELRGFRNYRHLDLDFTEPRTLLIGENGTGKSTVADAIEWVLTGRCRGVDGKGAGQKDLIRLGQDQASVTAVFSDLGPVTRTISRAGSAVSSMPTDAILGRLRVTGGMLAAVLSGRAFFTMHHGDAKAMLLQLLNVRIPKDQVPGVAFTGADGETFDLPTLELLYDQAFQNRAALKKTLVGTYVPDPPKVISIDLGGKTLADVQRELARDQNDLQTAIRNQAKVEQQRDAIKGKIDGATALAAGVEQHRGALKAHQDMLAEHQTQLKAAHDELAAAEAEPAEPVGSLEIQVREAASLVDKIERHASAQAQPVPVKRGKPKPAAPAEQPHACVLSSAIPCLTAISEFQGQVALLKSQQKNLEARITAGNARARKIAAAQQSVKGSERQVTYHEGQIRDVQAKLAAAEQAQADLPALKDSLAAANEAVQAGNLGLGNQRSDVERRQQQVAELAAYEQAQKNHQAAAARAADLAKQVADAEALVELLGPKGIRLQALDAALSDFLQAINAALEPFGFEVMIHVDPWKVEVNRGGTGWLPFSLLSKGQQLWTGLAFQLTLAALSGLGFCILDDAEAVVGTNRAVLTELVLGAPVDQVLLAMALPDDAPGPDIDGLQVIRVGAMSGDIVHGQSDDYQVGQLVTGP
jgi:DNA repair exonuclease SbcCD ATPase subunit